MFFFHLLHYVHLIVVFCSALSVAFAGIALYGISDLRAFGMLGVMCSIFIQLYDLLIVFPVCAVLKIHQSQYI